MTDWTASPVGGDLVVGWYDASISSVVGPAVMANALVDGIRIPASHGLPEYVRLESRQIGRHSRPYGSY